MSAKADQFFLMSRAALRLRSAVTVVLTGALCALVFHLYVERAKAEIETELAELKFERLLRGACKLPVHDGEATTFARAAGVGFCWELRQKKSN